MDAMQNAEWWDTSEARAMNRRDAGLITREVAAILAYIRNGDRVLDVACGEGDTLMALCAEKEIEATGVDRSSRAIAVAVARRDHRAAIAPDPPYSLPRDFRVMAFGELSRFYREKRPAFDCVFTQRGLINLASFNEQAQAVRNMLSLVAPGGCCLACEHSWDGLVVTNVYRGRVGLTPIKVPPYDRYLVDAEMVTLAEQLARDGWRMEAHDIANDYYYRSRVLNALDADLHGCEPSYGAALNDVRDIKAPSGFRGYARIWAWKKL